MSERKKKTEVIRICRICLAPEDGNQFEDFFDRRKDYAEKLYYLSKISVSFFFQFNLKIITQHFYLQVFEISSNAPALICSTCQNDLQIAARVKKIAIVADKYFKKMIKSEEIKLLTEIGINIPQSSTHNEMMVTEIKQEVDPSDFNNPAADEDFFSAHPFESNTYESDPEWNFDTEMKNTQAKSDEEDEDDFFDIKSPSETERSHKKSTKVKKSKSEKKYKEKDGSKRSYCKGGTKEGLCNICGINLTTRERLINHIKVRHEILSPENMIPCPVEGCRKRFKIQLYVDRHVENIHNKDKPVKEKEFWPCSFCGIILGSKTALKTHEHRHTVPAQEKTCHTFFCDLCSFSSDKKIRVQYHIERIHLQLRKFKCRMCPADFVHSSLLQYHELRVHLNLRKFVCRYCNKSFTRSSCRLIHERIHTNERPYRYLNINKILTNYNFLNLFSCRFCERTFIHHSDYRRHELRHTNGVPIKLFLEQMKQGVVQVT